MAEAERAERREEAEEILARVRAAPVPRPGMDPVVCALADIATASGLQTSLRITSAQAAQVDRGLAERIVVAWQLREQETSRAHELVVADLESQLTDAQEALAELRDEVAHG